MMRNSTAEWFVSSGIIQLRHTRHQDTMERTIQVTKLEELNTVNKFILLKLDSDGIKCNASQIDALIISFF